jgi:small conductance mechanosensitive channel
LKNQPKTGVDTFVLSFIKLGLKVVLFILIINQLGFTATSVAALLAGIGVAIGSAFNGSLGNFAGGFMIILNKPFKIGDYIEYDKFHGDVKEIGMIHTILITPENKTVFIPNGILSNGIILNWTRSGFIRSEFQVQIEHIEDIEKVKSIALSVFRNHPKVQNNPEPTIIIRQAIQGIITIDIRAFIDIKEIWSVKPQVQELILQELRKEHIEQAIPKQMLVKSDEA